jgi:hypothetical protein
LQRRVRERNRKDGKRVRDDIDQALPQEKTTSLLLAPSCPQHGNARVWLFYFFPNILDINPVFFFSLPDPDPAMGWLEGVELVELLLELVVVAEDLFGGFFVPNPCFLFL